MGKLERTSKKKGEEAAETDVTRVDMLYVSVWSETFLHMFVPTIQNINQVGLFTIIIPNACVSVDDILNDLGIPLLCQIGSVAYFS